MAANEEFYQKFGFTEMYEWAEIPGKKYGLFVEFDKEEPEKIMPYHTAGALMVGVSTICSSVISDDPDVWHNAFCIDDVGDIFMQKERLAVGIKEYDQLNELSYIHTKPWEHYIKVPYEGYDKNRNYVKRTNRNEWVKVNLIGKCIVYDDGTCKPGSYCTPYIGDDKFYWGHAVPSDTAGYYVLQRISKNTIEILNK